ncbi:hypothetical protein [Lacrimispora sp.]|uniref:hypothetical protein n=1 Tax=Lacrimispora sp. TaxID=2719234 RepID=UPI0028548C0A|nr:hypothetical protein [Lacrimispora sp.]MDR7810495.1 hypothetical protein [Lacrimispora sp.]
MKKRRFICFIIIVLCIIILFAYVRNRQRNVILMDDTWYALDGSWILLLSHGEPVQKDYEGIAKQLKGNYLDVNEAINKLSKLEQTVDVQNALAVGYIRLFKVEEAEAILRSILEEKDSDEERSICVLSNLGVVESMKGKSEESYKYFFEASQKKNQDPFQQLVVQSNLVIRNAYVKKRRGEGILNEIREIKILIANERKILGSNQMLGIYNYQSLGIASGMYDGKFNKGIEYMKKALEIAKVTYRYPDLEASIEYCLALIYEEGEKNYVEALEHINQAIVIINGWLPNNHESVISYYLERGNILTDLRRTDEAMSDYTFVLDNSSSSSQYSVLAYYYMGYEYEEQGETELAIDAYINAYYVNQNLGEKKVEEDSYDKLLHLYTEGNYKEKVIDFEEWLEEKKIEYFQVSVE